MRNDPTKQRMLSFSMNFRVRPRIIIPSLATRSAGDDLILSRSHPRQSKLSEERRVCNLTVFHLPGRITRSVARGTEDNAGPGPAPTNPLAQGSRAVLHVGRRAGRADGTLGMMEVHVGIVFIDNGKASDRSASKTNPSVGVWTRID